VGVGVGSCGQLGLGDTASRLVPTLVGAEGAFGESQVLTVSCGYNHSLAVTKEGALWTFGNGEDGALGHISCNDRLVLMCIDAQHFSNTIIVSVAAGLSHSAVATEAGTLYTWGKAPGTGHANRQAKLVPTLATPHLLQGVRVGRCHNLLPMHTLTFAMGTHARLGSADETACSAVDAVLKDFR